MWLWPTLFLTVEPQHLVRRWTKAHTLLTTNRPAHSQHTGLHANKAHAQNPRASHKTQARTLTTYRPACSQIPRTFHKAHALLTTYRPAHSQHAGPRAHNVQARALTQPTHFSQSPRAKPTRFSQHTDPRTHNTQARALTTYMPARSSSPRNSHKSHALLTKPTRFSQSPRAKPTRFSQHTDPRTHNTQARALTTYRPTRSRSPRTSHKAHAFSQSPRAKPTRFSQHTGPPAHNIQDRALTKPTLFSQSPRASYNIQAPMTVDSISPPYSRANYCLCKTRLGAHDLQGQWQA